VIIVELDRWRRDETPYLIFSCAKCKRWLYVKTTQKKKKCLSCGRYHTVQKILDKGLIVNGMSEAISIIKQKQNELALNEMSINPDLKTENSFFLFKVYKLKKKKLIANAPNIDYDRSFNELLIHLSKNYQRFPKYLIQLLAKDYEIPNSEITLLITKYTIKGILVPLKNDYYFLKNLNRC
jgi:hypothetical protein